MAELRNTRNSPVTEHGTLYGSELPEVLAHIERDGERFVVVWFPEGWGGDNDGRPEVLSDQPYWWRSQAIDRSEECS